MITKIQQALKEAGVLVWQIKKSENKRAELYFIKKQLDMPRYASIVEYQVTIYRDFAENGKKFRGSTNIFVEPGQDETEILQKVKDAFFAAQFVKNAFYELPEAIQEPKKESQSDLKQHDLQETVNAFADVILASSDDEEAFVNSAEIFVHRNTVEILGSNGLHVSYDSDKVVGEYVTQCVKPVDVEQYREFSYDHFEVNGLKEAIAHAIEDVRLRAVAKNAPKTGKYDVLLSGEDLVAFFDYYLSRSAASVVYPGYSTWKKGERVQKEVTSGEELTIDLVATQPYSDDGIPMRDRALLKNGVMQSLHGGTRFMRYLGEEPTGSFDKFAVHNGTMNLTDMKKDGVLEAVSFSDFQMDFFTGHFGGELRLALMHEKGKSVPLTGGAINGSLLEVEDRLIFSKERYETSTYSGPYAVLIPDVPVAGE